VDTLKPCGYKPNCVCSLDTRGDFAIEPIAFAGDPQIFWRTLEEKVRAMPRTELVERGKNYLRFEVKTLIFRFVDDLEFLLGNDVVHVRSASRVGYSDMGVNRRRVEDIRKLLQSAVGR
jgi:uncharacterized protein (DUF1499 family)